MWWLHERLPNGWAWATLERCGRQASIWLDEPLALRPWGPATSPHNRHHFRQRRLGNSPLVRRCTRRTDTYLLRTGDVSSRISGATFGRSYLVIDPPPSVFASYLVRLRPVEVCAKYVYWFLQSAAFWTQAESAKVGMAQPNLSASKIGAIRVPSPHSQSKRGSSPPSKRASPGLTLESTVYWPFARESTPSDSPCSRHVSNPVGIASPSQTSPMRSE